jgi:hypothetical protein
MDLCLGCWKNAGWDLGNKALEVETAPVSLDILYFVTCLFTGLAFL